MPAERSSPIPRGPPPGTPAPWPSIRAPRACATPCWPWRTPRSRAWPPSRGGALLRRHRRLARVAGHSSPPLGPGRATMANACASAARPPSWKRSAPSARSEALAHHIEILKLRPDDMQAEAEILRLAGKPPANMAWRPSPSSRPAPGLPPAAPRKVQLLLIACRLFDENARDKPRRSPVPRRPSRPRPPIVPCGSPSCAWPAQGAWQTAVDAALSEPFDGGVLLGDFLPLMERRQRRQPMRRTV
jgi:hypothetical protein